MFTGKTLRNYFSALILGVYLFAALFSQNFHHHQSTVYQTSEGISAGNNFSNSYSVADGAGCLWCHFLYTGHSYLPEEFSFNFASCASFSAKIFSFDFESVFLLSGAVFLRGPPLGNIY